MKHGKKISLNRVSIEKQSILASIAVFLSLDRFTWLFWVLNGHLAIIGCSPVSVSQGIQIINNNTAGYRPGVFSYSEAEDWPQNTFDSDIVDHYYAVHSNLIKDIFLTQKALFNRIHHEDKI